MNDMEKLRRIRLANLEIRKFASNRWISRNADLFGRIFRKTWQISLNAITNKTIRNKTLLRMMELPAKQC